MSENCKITVVTVVYNCVTYLEDCIKSVLNQPYSNIEYVVIDGGSTDGSVDVIRRYESQIAFWVSEPDRGIYHAMNKGIEKATGDYLIFLGADDRLLDDFSAMVSQFSDPTTIYYGNMLFKGAVCFGEFNDYKVCKYQIPHQATFYPKRVFEYYRYDEKYKIAADFLLTMQCKADKRFRFEYKDYLVAFFREGGVSQVKDALFESHRGRLIRELFGMKLYFRYKFHALKGTVRKNH